MVIQHRLKIVLRHIHHQMEYLELHHIKHQQSLVQHLLHRIHLLEMVVTLHYHSPKFLMHQLQMCLHLALSLYLQLLIDALEEHLKDHLLEIDFDR